MRASTTGGGSLGSGPGPQLGGPVYMNSSAEVTAEVPLAVVTVTFTVLWPGGLVTRICVPDSETIAAATPPKLTLVASDRVQPRNQGRERGAWSALGDGE